MARSSLVDRSTHADDVVLVSGVSPLLDVSSLVGAVARIEAGQQVLTANQQLLAAELRALSAQAQSPSRAQDGERAWQLCPDQSEGLPAAVVDAALQRATEHGARASADLARRPLIPPSALAAMRADLPKASWELELIVLVTPYLRAVTDLLAAAEEHVLVNSEVYAWIQTPLENRRLWQKPDLFLCHRSAYVAADPPGQDSENAQWRRALDQMAKIGTEQFVFGRGAWPLRDVVECLFEGKRQRVSLHEATGECLAKARNLLYRSTSDRSFITPRQVVKCVLFDQETVYLLQFDHSPEGGLRAARRFGWSDPGSFVVLLDFLQASASITPRWVRVIRQATSHFGCSLLPRDSFLGHGGMGRVFKVAAAGSQYALKVVESGSADNRVVLLEAEFAHLQQLREKAATLPDVLALLPSSPDDAVMICENTDDFAYGPCGAAVRFTPIGQSVALRFPKQRSQQLWRAVSSALWQLHCHGCYHGDARLENLLLVPKRLPSVGSPASHTRAGVDSTPERLSWQLDQAQLVWIDFRDSSVHPRRCALDCQTVLCSFFRIPVATTREHPLLARLVSDYEHMLERSVAAKPQGPATTSQDFATWLDASWQALGVQSNADGESKSDGGRV